MVEELRKRKIEPWLVTGDNRRTAVAIATQVRNVDGEAQIYIFVDQALHE